MVLQSQRLLLNHENPPMLYQNSKSSHIVWDPSCSIFKRWSWIHNDRNCIQRDLLARGWHLLPLPASSRRHFLGRNRDSFLEPQLNIKPKRPVAAPCFEGIDLTRFAGRRKLKQLLVAWQEPMGSCRLVYVIKSKILFLFTDVSLTVIIGKKHSVDWHVMPGSIQSSGQLTEV